MGHPFSLAFALHFAAAVRRLCREARAVQEQAEAVITLSSEQGFPYFLAGGTFLRGWALAEQGQVEEGIAQMHQGLAAWRATGVEQLGQLAVVVAGMYGKIGQIEEGLDLLAEALTEMHKSGEHWWEAELYRTRGELLLAQEGKNQKPVLSLVEGAKGKREKEPEAEECFQRAIEIARQQSAKSLELRAVMSLTRLLQEQGKKGEARRLLAEIYGWFTEGFATADLQEAKALLEEWGSG
jgi:predicted ATPase